MLEQLVHTVTTPCKGLFGSLNFARGLSVKLVWQLGLWVK